MEGGVTRVGESGAIFFFKWHCVALFGAYSPSKTSRSAYMVWCRKMHIRKSSLRQIRYSMCLSTFLSHFLGWLWDSPGLLWPQWELGLGVSTGQWYQGQVSLTETVRLLASASREGVGLQGLTPARNLNYSLPLSSDKIQGWGGGSGKTQGGGTLLLLVVWLVSHGLSESQGSL